MLAISGCDYTDNTLELLMTIDKMGQNDNIYY